MVLTPDKIDSTTAYSYQFRFGYGGVQRRLYYAGAWDDWQEAGISDAPNDGNTYARKDGTWTNLTRQIGKQLINFVPLEYDGSDVTDLDNLPSGITIVNYADGPGYGGYMVMTSLEGSGYGYQIKISIEGLSYRYNNGTWGAWSSIG